MLLYHGSNMQVTQPKILKLREMDFGYGFYLTSNETQARQFANKVVLREAKLNNNPGVATVNIYELALDIAESELQLLEFAMADEKWLDFVVANRQGRVNEDNSDIVIGPIANDDVFEVIRLYEAGIATKEMALAAMKVKNLFNQYVIKTDKAIALLSFVGAEEA